jgi:hypothetical protein
MEVRGECALHKQLRTDKEWSASLGGGGLGVG